MKNSILAFAVTSAISGVVRAADSPVPVAPAVPEPCASLQEFRATDCSLTWHGITLYGAYDVGVG